MAMNEPWLKITIHHAIHNGQPTRTLIAHNRLGARRFLATTFAAQNERRTAALGNIDLEPPSVGSRGSE